MNKIFLTIRKITVAPIMAIVMLVILQIFCPDVFQSISLFLCSICFLGIVPILAYPMQRFFPYFKEKGREGQRSLAMIFAVIGYIFGVLTCLITNSSIDLIIIYLEYLLSGVLILICNKVVHIRISGHACGVVGPIALLAYFGRYISAFVGCFMAALVYLASIKTKRHTAWQLIGGSIVPIVSLFVLCLLIS